MSGMNCKSFENVWQAFLSKRIETPEEKKKQRKNKRKKQTWKTFEMKLQIICKTQGMVLKIYVS